MGFRCSGASVKRPRTNATYQFEAYPRRFAEAPLQVAISSAGARRFNDSFLSPFCLYVLTPRKLNRVEGNAILPIEVSVDVNLCALGLSFLQIAHAEWEETVFRRMHQEEITRFRWQRRRI